VNFNIPRKYWIRRREFKEHTNPAHLVFVNVVDVVDVVDVVVVPVPFPPFLPSELPPLPLPLAPALPSGSP
jgi:hypothetical protein